jgi:hypothetical protein
MRDYTRIRVVELAIEPTVVETEKVLNGLIRALRDVLKTSVFSIEVVSKPRITPEGKALADSKAQQPRQYVSISRGLQRRHPVSDRVMRPPLNT